MHPMLNIATQAARQAGKICLQSQARPDDLRTWQKADGSWTSSADKACEKRIIEIIRKHHPAHTIVSEESAEQWPDILQAAFSASSTAPAEPVWIVDPIDGTRNFIKGNPHVAISIAVAWKGRLQLGLIYDPFRDELFTAERQNGAQCEGKRIRCHTQQAAPTPGQLLLGVGLSHQRLHEPTTLSRLLQMGSIRSTGSAALDLAYVAAARLDAVLHYSLSPWDWAAGVLIAQEAGILCSDWTGDPDTRALCNGHILAAAPKVHPELLEAIASPD